MVPVRSQYASLTVDALQWALTQPTLKTHHCDRGAQSMAAVYVPNLCGLDVQNRMVETDEAWPDQVRLTSSIHAIGELVNGQG